MNAQENTRLTAASMLRIRLKERPSAANGASQVSDTSSPLGVLHLILDELDEAELQYLLSGETARLWMTSHMAHYLDAIASFYRTKNRAFADRALEMAAANGYPLGGILAYVQIHAAWATKEENRPQSHLKAMRHEYLPTAYSLIHLMVQVDIPLEEASGRAARWLDKVTDGRLCYKSSSLSKMFSKDARTHTDFLPLEPQKKDQQANSLRAAFPEVLEALKGSRR